jgi:gliding motility-associated-like protein
MSLKMVFIKSILMLLVFMASAITCRSQCISINLILNPDLEEYICCPNNMTMISCATYWSQPITSGSTSDYFNTCGLDSLIGPDILPFFKHEFFGEGYAGIHAYGYNGNTIPPALRREYLQGTLSTDLYPGQCYYCSFWVKLFNLENQTPFAAIDAIGIYFSDTLPKQADTDAMAMYFPAQVNNQTGRIITDTTSWTKITDTFIAGGGERYFTVGTFKQESEINKEYFYSPHNNFSYYFFDNFSLCPCSDTIPPPEPPNAVYIPNIFSPNGDGNNDVLYVRGQNISAVDFKVYNRWGNLVYEGKDHYSGWDGRFQSKACPEGVYFYMAKVTYANGEVVTKTGNVTLVR